MKKALLALSLTAALLGTTSVYYADSFTASADGFGGEVSVTLTIEDNQLTDVTIDGPDETPAVGGMAIGQIAEAMLANNSVEVNGVSGATFSSTAALTAAKEALAASGAELVSMENEAVEEAASEQPAEDETTDVLVIGGGAAGISAAIAATEAGADVILVEKLGFLGGCTSMSGGVFTRAAVEGDDEPAMSGEDLFDFLMETSDYKAKEDLVHYYVDNSIDTYNWVYDNMIKNPDSVHRFAMMPESIVSPQLPGAGSELMADVIDYVNSLGVDIRYNTPATEFITEDGKVIGAVVTRPDGSAQNIYAKGGVVLASGGFASSPQKLALYSTPGAETITSTASAGTVGDGLDMAQAVGADIHFNDDWDTCGAFFSSLMVYDGYDAFKFFDMVLLNAEGKRFMSEASGMPTVYTEMRHEIAKGLENKFWFLLDENIEEDPQFLIDHQGAQIAETVEELAQITGLEVSVLQETIDAYNAGAGTDNDEFGKPAEYHKGLTAPYIVFEDKPMRTTTIGGLRINRNSEVLDENDEPIPGLYAGGEVANADFYGTIYTCGTAVGSAFVFGRTAGTNAAANAVG